MLASFCAAMGLDWEDADGLDEAGCLFLNDLFFEGEGLRTANCLIAALKHMFPVVGRLGPLSLPRCSKAILGWKTLVPPLMRLPMPFLLLAALIGMLLSSGEVTMALAFWTMFHAYLRPGELQGLTSANLVRPTSTCPYWGLILHPSESGVVSKVGLTDESLLMDSVAGGEFLGPFLAEMANQDPSLQLMGLAKGQARVRLKALLLQFKVKNYDLYQMRHGGASHDFLSENRQPLAIKMRLRHASDSSMARYTKGTRSQLEAGKLPPPVILLGQFVAANVAHVFHQPASIPAELVKPLA